MTPPSDLPLIFEIYGWNAAALRPFRKAYTVNFIIVVSSIVILRIISSFCEKCKYFIIPFSYVTAFSIGLLTSIIIQYRSVTFLKFFSTRKKPRLPRRTRLTFPIYAAQVSCMSYRFGARKPACCASSSVANHISAFVCS